MLPIYAPLWPSPQWMWPIQRERSPFYKCITLRTLSHLCTCPQWWVQTCHSTCIMHIREYLGGCVYISIVQRIDAILHAYVSAYISASPGRQGCRYVILHAYITPCVAGSPYLLKFFNSERTTFNYSIVKWLRSSKNSTSVYYINHTKCFRFFRQHQMWVLMNILGLCWITRIWWKWMHFSTS
jgi:hypothetical protein